MSIARNGGVLREIREVFGAGRPGASEGDLLDRFLAGGDEGAFAAIVARHGAMVAGVCRRRLDDPNDVEDAFQVTFLVLVRRAGTIRDRDRLGTWLHEVARSVAGRARRASGRRRVHEAWGAIREGSGRATDESGTGEALAVLDEEIARLPERFRLPLVLCHLEGLSQGEAAVRLGWTAGAVRGRLARAREILRGRLARRGVVPAVAAAALAGSEARAFGPVPGRLVAGTARCAARMVGGRAMAGGEVPPRLAAQTLEVTRNMLWTRSLKALAAGTIVLGLAVATLARSSFAQGTGSTTSAPAPPPPKAQAPKPKPRSKIYTTAQVGARNPAGTQVLSIIAIDPETGDRDVVLDDTSIRPRVSTDGRSVAFTRGGSLLVQPVDAGGEARKILDMEGEMSASPPVWSRDGKQIIVSLGNRGKGSPWVYKTIRVDVDGSNRSELTLPPEDGVFDWSSDGRWLLTASSRDAKIGWQLYVMHPDGTEARQITEGGNPFYCRFSPDGRRVLYTDGTTEERRGIWVVGSDGKDRRKVFATTDKTLASACWSPDGSRIAVILRDIDAQGAKSRIEVIDLDTGSRKTLSLPEGTQSDMPDWR